MVSCDYWAVTIKNLQKDGNVFANNYFCQTTFVRNPFESAYEQIKQFWLFESVLRYGQIDTIQSNESIEWEGGWISIRCLLSAICELTVYAKHLGLF